MKRKCYPVNTRTQVASQMGRRPIGFISEGAERDANGWQGLLNASSTVGLWYPEGGWVGLALYPQPGGCHLQPSESSAKG